jgi:hypothetical protein
MGRRHGATPRGGRTLACLTGCAGVPRRQGRGRPCACLVSRLPGGMDGRTLLLWQERAHTLPVWHEPCYSAAPMLFLRWLATSMGLLRLIPLRYRARPAESSTRDVCSRTRQKILAIAMEIATFPSYVTWYEPMLILRGWLSCQALGTAVVRRPIRPQRGRGWLLEHQCSEVGVAGMPFALITGEPRRASGCEAGGRGWCRGERM